MECLLCPLPLLARFSIYSTLNNNNNNNDSRTRNKTLNNDGGGEALGFATENPHRPKDSPKSVGSSSA